VTGEQECREGFSLDINCRSGVELQRLVIRGHSEDFDTEYRLISDNKFWFEIDRDVTIDSPIKVRLQKFDYFDMKYVDCHEAWYAMFYVFKNDLPLDDE